MKDFRTFNAAVSFYRSSLSLRLCGTLKEQLSRAASSIALNLAEGRGKESRKDQVKFFFIALGSLRECPGGPCFHKAENIGREESRPSHLEAS